MSNIQWKCQECHKKFKTTKAAERASRIGCPKCGGVDIDIENENRPKDFTEEQQKEMEN